MGEHTGKSSGAQQGTELLIESSGKAMNQAAPIPPARFRWDKLRPETMTVSDYYKIPKVALDGFALLSGDTASSLLLKARQNEERLNADNTIRITTESDGDSNDSAQQDGYNQEKQSGQGAATVAEQNADSDVEEFMTGGFNYCYWRAAKRPGNQWSRNDAMLALQAEFWKKNPGNRRKDFDIEKCQIQEDHPALEKYHELAKLINQYYDDIDKDEVKGHTNKSKSERIRAVENKVWRAYLAYEHNGFGMSEMIMDRFVHPYGHGNSAILGYTQSMGILSELDIMHGHKNDRQVTSSDFDSLISGLKGMTEELGAVQERISNLLSAFASIEKQLQGLQNCLASQEQVDKLKTTVNQGNQGVANYKASYGGSKVPIAKPVSVSKASNSGGSSNKATSKVTNAKSNTVPKTPGASASCKATVAKSGTGFKSIKVKPNGIPKTVAGMEKKRPRPEGSNEASGSKKQKTTRLSSPLKDWIKVENESDA
ncbi:hypothetical protein RAB80_001485 [Fusarium oxysporum f. sp. vasinfectum]|uniref:Uncharacterized protein n=1 Tax=Fusarium oxysporum f. sp. vasinfectum 25433 TaxID=1089449 RepID=X0LW93_FUSOX|nr:hypothetical protein FOTG_04316 [Fusarium oxysporum f. sp. vasinfectum 25433]KAK2683539.1 hypothetical protein RAB80_001485 [Fusarium oxysporum f. sp. vasinfectum]KAK2937209.1 hypothetical protein FoTM2_000427 [Fusarium oxysporum f. sp. vasinfectum]